MKMTVEFDDRLMRAAEAHAVERGETLAGPIERILADYVQNDTKPAGTLGLLTKGGTPMPGVNVDGRVALYDLVDALD